MAAMINPKVRHPGQPWFARAATAIAARAKGKAKTVWENRMNEPHFWMPHQGQGRAGPGEVAAAERVGTSVS